MMAISKVSKGTSTVPMPGPPPHCATGISGDAMKAWVQQEMVRRYESNQTPQGLHLKMFGPGDEVKFGDTWLWSVLKQYCLHSRFYEDELPPHQDPCYCLPACAFMPAGCKHASACVPPVANMWFCGDCAQCIRCGMHLGCTAAGR